MGHTDGRPSPRASTALPSASQGYRRRTQWPSCSSSGKSRNRLMLHLLWTCAFRRSLWPKPACASSRVKPGQFSSQVLELLRCSPYLKMALVLLWVQWEHLYPQMSTVSPKCAHLEPCAFRQSLWPERARASSWVRPSHFSSQVLELKCCSPCMEMALSLIHI